MFLEFRKCFFGIFQVVLQLYSVKSYSKFVKFQALDPSDDEEVPEPVVKEAEEKKVREIFFF